MEGKVGAFYRAFMDEDRIEALGGTPLNPELAAIRAANTYEQLGLLMGRSQFDFDGTFFGISIDADPKDPSRYAVSLGQQGLGLPDRDYYLDPGFAAQLAKYQQYVEQLLGLINWPDPPGNAAHIVAMETRIAEVSWTKAEESRSQQDLQSADDIRTRGIRAGLPLAAIPRRGAPCFHGPSHRFGKECLSEDRSHFRRYTH